MLCSPVQLSPFMPIADDMDGELRRRRVQFLAEVARRAAASLLAVSQHDDHAGLVAIVEHLCGVLHRGGERGLAGGVERIHLLHDEPGRVLGGLEIELDIALLIGPGPVGDEPDAPARG